MFSSQPAPFLFLSFFLSAPVLSYILCIAVMGGSDPGKADRDKISKRKKTAIHKAFELADLCYAKVFLLIEHPRGTTIFNSVEDHSWPPPSLVPASNPLTCHSEMSAEKFLFFPFF